MFGFFLFFLHAVSSIHLEIRRGKRCDFILVLEVWKSRCDKKNLNPLKDKSHKTLSNMWVVDINGSECDQMVWYFLINSIAKLSFSMEAK